MRLVSRVPVYIRDCLRLHANSKTHDLEHHQRDSRM